MTSIKTCTMDIGLFYLCFFIAFGLNLIIFYHIIKSASKSKELLNNSNMQLNIAVKMALKNGLDESELSLEIAKLETVKFIAKRKRFMDDKITRDEYLALKKTFETKYPEIAVTI